MWGLSGVLTTEWSFSLPPSIPYDFKAKCRALSQKDNYSEGHTHETYSGCFILSLNSYLLWNKVKSPTISPPTVGGCKRRHVASVGPWRHGSLGGSLGRRRVTWTSWEQLLPPQFHWDSYSIPPAPLIAQPQGRAAVPRRGICSPTASPNKRILDQYTALSKHIF